MSALHFTPIITDHVLSTSCDLVQLFSCSKKARIVQIIACENIRFSRYARNVPGGEERETDVFAGYSN